MTPQYQFNLGQADPLLSIAQNNPEGYISVIEQELQKLNNVKQQLNINSSITVWDVYVAINAQYHDYVRLYSEWFRNINKNELDNKIIESAITFILKMKILVVLKLGITLKQLIEFILDLLLRQYVFLNMLPLLLFIYLIQKIYYFSLFFFK